jgi:hypothetical protein
MLEGAMLEGAMLGPVFPCGCHKAILGKAPSEFPGAWQGMMCL